MHPSAIVAFLAAASVAIAAPPSSHRSRMIDIYVDVEAVTTSPTTTDLITYIPKLFTNLVSQFEHHLVRQDRSGNDGYHHGGGGSRDNSNNSNNNEEELTMHDLDFTFKLLASPFNPIHHGDHDEDDGRKMPLGFEKNAQLHVSQAKLGPESVFTLQNSRIIFSGNGNGNSGKVLGYSFLKGYPPHVALVSKYEPGLEFVAVKRVHNGGERMLFLEFEREGQ